MVIKKAISELEEEIKILREIVEEDKYKREIEWSEHHEMLTNHFCNKYEDILG